jgi:hypothetical protein
MAFFPGILIIAFGVLYFIMRNRKPGHVDENVLAAQPQR